MTTPAAALPLPLKGATPAARQSRLRGVRLAGGRRATLEVLAC
jgi:hypothetical protein